MSTMRLILHMSSNSNSSLGGTLGSFSNKSKPAPAISPCTKHDHHFIPHQWSLPSPTPTSLLSVNHVWFVKSTRNDEGITMFTNIWTEGVYMVLAFCSFELYSTIQPKCLNPSGNFPILYMFPSPTIPTRLPPKWKLT